MPDDAQVIEERRGAVATLVLNRPAVLNALDGGMALLFRDAARRVAGDGTVRAVVLRGAGRAFMAGGDVGAFHRAGADAPAASLGVIGPLHEALETLAAMPKPLLVGAQGAVAGAGVSLLLAADLAVASDDAVISMAYMRIGASMDGGSTWSLPRIVGLRKAMEMALLSEPIRAEEALRLSLVNRVVAAEALAAETDALADRLASGPTVAFGHMKRLLRGSFEHDLAAQLGREAEGFAACAGTADFREGVGAFVEKRRPGFVGS